MTAEEPLGADFWADPAAPPSSAGGLSTAALDPYAAALSEMFPLGLLFRPGVPPPGQGKTRGTGPETCIALGANVLGYARGEGYWSRTVGTLSLVANPQKERPCSTLASRPCNTPGEFRRWLNWVASKILDIDRKLLVEQLHQDNFLPDFRLALQAAHNLWAIGAAFEMAFPEIPTLQWTPDPIKPMTFGVTLLFKGQTGGKIALTRKEGRWRYGAVIQTTVEALKFKHEAPETVDLSPKGIGEAKRLAERLFYAKMFEWLTLTAVSKPDLRGA